MLDNISYGHQFLAQEEGESEGIHKEPVCVVVEHPKPQSYGHLILSSN